MKKLLLLCVAAVFAAGTSFAKTADQVRIYINPGHGGWGPDDRPMATIPYPMLASTGRPDTCGFYESNTNLWKCLELGACLQRMGVQRSNIMYSRVKNGPYPYDEDAWNAWAYDRSLSEISAEVNANNMDMFISIHSDANYDGSTANYPLFLYRGYDAYELVYGSVDMCNACWGPHYENGIDVQSAYSVSNANIRGDVSFYHGSNSNGYLGVLKHSTPGFLMEGYFHTYQPARHRALNKDYCGQEGIRVARGVCNYFGLNPESTGYIMGTIKDKNETIVNDLFQYVAGSNDQYMPVNGAKVKLLKDGNVVATYQVDYNYNGVFVFSGLQPGNYTFSIEKQGYNDLQGSENVTAWVSANATTYVNLHVVKNGETIVDDNPNTGNTDTNTGVTFQKDYPNYREPNLTAGTMAPTSIRMKQQSSNLAIKGTVKRMLVHGDTTVILTNEGTTPHLYLVNNSTRSIIKEMSTYGIAAAEPNNAGFYSRLNDIAFAADDKLIGVNSVRCQDTEDYVDDGYQRGILRCYLWDNADANPQEWFDSYDAGYFYRADVGGALAVNGPSYNCYVGVTAITSASSRSMRFMYFSRVNGVTPAVTYSNDAPSSTFSEGQQGTNLQLAISPRSDYYWVLSGNNTYPLEYQSGNEETDATVIGRFSDAAVGVSSVGIQFFKYAKHQFMVTPFVKDNSIGGVRLYDITNGLDKATLVNTTNTELATYDPSTAMGAGAQVKNNKIYLYLLHGTTFTAFEGDDVATLISKVENGNLSAAFNGDELVVSAPETVKTVQVYSPSGSLVAEGSSSTLNASHLSSGLYLVKVNNLPAVKALKK